MQEETDAREDTRERRRPPSAHAPERDECVIAFGGSRSAVSSDQREPSPSGVTILSFGGAALSLPAGGAVRGGRVMGTATGATGKGELISGTARRRARRKGRSCPSGDVGVGFEIVEGDALAVGEDRKEGVEGEARSGLGSEMGGRTSSKERS